MSTNRTKTRQWINNLTDEEAIKFQTSFRNFIPEMFQLPLPVYKSAKKRGADHEETMLHRRTAVRRCIRKRRYTLSKINSLYGKINAGFALTAKDFLVQS